MNKKHRTFGVSATSLALALATVPGNAQEALPTIDVGAAPAPVGPSTSPARVSAPALSPAPAAVDSAPGFSPERLRQPVYREPPGQTVTSVATKTFENESIVTVGDVLNYSPGVTIYQGNSVRDVVISIRGAGARSSTGLANIVVLEDGFSLTPSNGGGTSIATTNNMDPHAYGAIDVYRGGSSALFGNYAMEGAVNFRHRTGAEIDGGEYGVEYGSFGTLQNWLIAGKHVGDFDLSFFGSDVRSDSWELHNGFNTQTFNFLGTWTPAPSDRVTLKVDQNDMLALMSGRENWTMFNLNPFQRGYGCAYLTTLNSPFCYSAGAVFKNGIFGATVPQSASEIGMHRHNTRDTVGLRWEHDFDNQTTWRTQGSWDLLDVEQPNQPTQQVRGPSAALNFQTDITSHAQLFGHDATHFLNFFYTNTHSTNNAYATVPYNFNLGAIGALQTAQSNFQSDIGLKAREEVALTRDLTGVVGFSSTWTKIYGFQESLNYTSAVLQSQPKLISAAHAYWETAPEATLTYRYSPEWTIRARYETGYAAPAAGNLFTDSTGNPGDNTLLKPQSSMGGDLGVDWTPANWNFKGSATIFNEWWRNQFLSVAGTVQTQTTFVTNIPSSIHRGFETNFEWRPIEGWRAIANYTYNDQFFTNLNDQMATSGLKVSTFSVQRAGEKLPGVSKHQFTGRIGYDQPNGPLKGLGAFVEYQYRGDYPVDNANLAWAPGYGIVNVDLHYDRDIEYSFVKKFSIYFDVRNITNRTYFSSGAVIADTLVAKTILQSPQPTVLNALTVVPGSPRAFTVGMKLKF